ncbi:site-specific DNA-methyltransferase [Candidatus Saccharibacteria bacterium]|nr:site-specific DNA-methyltransferase [Candidatus Saccharibacteria bacterium]
MQKEVSAMGRRLEEYTHEELIEYIKELKQQARKRYGLVWEEKIKPEKVVEECDTKIPVVKEIEEKVIGDEAGEPTNIIIEGDNYHALSVLNYTHTGKIDVIYIDPPYNTGNKDFIYNDCYVDKEDTFRHSKWLSFMSRRLELAKNLLKDDGVIFISIDDNEYATLKLLCDSIFGSENFICPLIWNTKNASKGVPPVQMVTSIHEYVLVYGKKSSRFKFFGIKRTTDDFSNPDNDPRGLWRKEALVSTISKKTFEIVDPKTGNVFNRAWAFSKETIDKMIEEGRVIFPRKPNGTPLQKKFFNDYTNEGLPITTQLGTFQSRKATSDLMNIFSNEKKFDFPKPIDLMKFLISQSTENGIILDFFAGSGTTGQAVMELNKEDGGHRQFILVTNNEANGQTDAGAEGIAEKVTYPRIKTVITGVRPDGTKYSDGIPANLRYFKTDFVEKGKTTDDTREALIMECSDMIRIRENAFEHIASAPEYRFYKNDKVFVPIIFDQFAIAETWEKVEELNTEKLPVHCYNFSYNRHANEEEIPESTKLEWTACSIPETVLEVYRKIFRKKEV